MLYIISWKIVLVVIQFQNLCQSVGANSVYTFNQDRDFGNTTDPADIPLFYGWFFDEASSLSLLKISQLYFSSSFNRVPDFIEFIYKNMNQYHITNPFAFFRKPLDPDTLRPLDLYHVTAKFCGRLDCSRYAEIAAPYVGKKFQIHIIGLFFTAKTYGFRIKLLAEEEDLFEEQIEKLNELSTFSHLPIFNENDYSAILNGRNEEITAFPEIHFVPQKVSFHPSNSKAHSTIGCAPNIDAVQTGFDLKEIERLETSNDTPHKDYGIGVYSPAVNLPGAILRRYGDVEKPLAFVIYPRDEMIAQATFRYYI